MSYAERRLRKSRRAKTPDQLRKALHDTYYPIVQVPRTGAHLNIWGSGHSCHSDEAHDQCVCDCGVPRL